jgi:hypothetical protein
MRNGTTLKERAKKHDNSELGKDCRIIEWNISTRRIGLVSFVVSWSVTKGMD